MSKESELTAHYQPDYINREQDFITLAAMKEKAESYAKEVIDFLENYDSEVLDLEESYKELEDENSELKDKITELEEEIKELKGDIE